LGDAFGGVAEGVPDVGVPQSGVRRGLGRGNSIDSSSSSAHVRSVGGRLRGAFGRFLDRRVSTSSTLTGFVRNAAEQPKAEALDTSDSDIRRRRRAPDDQCSW
jgi:hypothetical protein